MASFFFIDDHPARAGRKGARGKSSSVNRTANGAPVQQGVEPPDSAHGDWAATSSFRKEVRPPALFARSQPQWRQWLTTAWNWLWDEQDLEDHPQVLKGLTQVKAEFMSIVWDLQSYTATRVRESITQARSLRELWHLRADLFRLIAVHRGQAEASRRLESLDRHFPVRVSAAAAPAPKGKASQW